MTRLQHDWHWLDAGETIGFAELARACGLDPQELGELIEYGAVHPAPTQEEQGLFSAECVGPLRTACALRRAYDLDLFSVVLLAEHLQRIEDLEHEVRRLRAGLPEQLQEPTQRDAPQSWREPHGA